MARFNANEADSYGGSGGSQFFSLKNDLEVAKVRFMYNGMEDIVGEAVHEVKIDDKRRNVSCLRSAHDPKSVCPLCAANNFQRAKLYIPVYNTETGEVTVWERGKTFFQKMSSICSRYVNGNTPLVAHTFEIERHGKPGDTNTTYEIYETGSDNTKLEDLPEIPDVYGNIILEKSADEMRFYLEKGFFPNGDGAPSRSSSYDDDMPSGRRTPSRRSEAF